MGECGGYREMFFCWIIWVRRVVRAMYIESRSTRREIMFAGEQRGVESVGGEREAGKRGASVWRCIRVSGEKTRASLGDGKRRRGREKEGGKRRRDEMHTRSHGCPHTEIRIGFERNRALQERGRERERAWLCSALFPPSIFSRILACTKHARWIEENWNQLPVAMIVFNSRGKLTLNISRIVHVDPTNHSPAMHPAIRDKRATLFRTCEHHRTILHPRSSNPRLSCFPILVSPNVKQTVQE